MSAEGLVETGGVIAPSCSSTGATVSVAMCGWGRDSAPMEARMASTSVRVRWVASSRSCSLLNSITMSVAGGLVLAVFS